MTARIITFLLVLLLVGATGCRKADSATDATAKTEGKPAEGKEGDGPGNGEKTDEKKEAVPVEVAEARIGDISSYLLYNSTLETEGAVEIYPQISGLIRELLVEEGDRVDAGDVLLRLDDDELRVAAKEAEVTLERLESTFKRTQDLSERGMINEQDFESARFDLAQARLRLESAQLRLDQTIIRAPVAGVITERAVQIGARVAPATMLFGMMRLDEMIARVYVPGRHLTSVQVGQTAELSSDFLPDVKFEGWIKRISPVVDPRSGTFKVTIGVKALADQAPPGLFVAVKIITDTHLDAVLVPKEAVVYEGGERFVFSVKEGIAQKQKLEGGYDNTTSVEAVAGIEKGTQIIVLGQNGLKDGTPVRVVMPKTSAVTGIESPQQEPGDA
ncbi:MAG: efflux RND transporter periplasmic adaptor subunit [Opitutaceae bacterium]